MTRWLRIVVRLLAGAAITAPGGGSVYAATVRSLGAVPELAPPIPTTLAPIAPAVLPSGALLS